MLYNKNFDNSALIQLGDQTHVWWMRSELLINHPRRDRFLSLMDREERDRHCHFHFARDRDNYFAAHVLVRLILSRYIDLSPSAWRFTRKAHGRPEIANSDIPPLRFNLTHTNGLSACVVTLNDDCGIDAEQLDAGRSLQAVARRMFSPAEASQLESMDGEARLEYFYSRWTLREAYVKARGIGLSLPTREIEFDINQDNRVTAQFSARLNNDSGRWKFELIHPCSRYVLAIALASGKAIFVSKFNL